MSSLLALVLCTAALAAEPLGRDLSGHLVTAGRAPQVLVFWSLEAENSLAEVSALEAAGLDVVLVNVDAAGARSKVAPRLRALGIDAPVIADAAGALKQRYGVGSGSALVLVDDDGAAALRQVGRVDALAIVAASGLATVARND